MSAPQNQAQLAGAAKRLGQNGLIAVTWVGCGLAAAFVALRCYARFREARRLFSDDYWVIAALMFLTINAILQTLQTPYLYYLVYLAAGRVQAGEELLVEGNKYVRYEFVIIGLFWTVLWCIKGSFLALYYRLFEGLPKYRMIWWGCVVFTFFAYVGCWIASVWTCHPPSTYFHFGQCDKHIDNVGSQISISYSTAVDVISDMMIMALPLRILRQLQVSRQQKFGLAGVFCVGLIIMATAIVRMTQVLGADRTDPVGLAVWGVVETSISVMVGSLPPLKSFLAKRISKFATAHKGYIYGGKNGAYVVDTKGGKGTQMTSDISKSGTRAECIPLDEVENGNHSLSALKGQIVVTKDYGWTVSGSVSDSGSIKYRADDDEANIIGVATSENPRGNKTHDPVEGRTWLRTSVQN